MDKGKSPMPESSYVNDSEELNLAEKLYDVRVDYEGDLDSDEDLILKRKGKKITRNSRRSTRSRTNRPRTSNPNLELTLSDIHRRLDECETFTPVEEANIIGTGVANEINLPADAYPDLSNQPAFNPYIMQPPLVNQGNPEFWWTNDTQFQYLMNAPDGLAPWPYREPEPDPHWPQVNPSDLVEISQFADELTTMGNRLTHMGNVLTWKFHGHNQFGGGQW
jgi:hypothetical protein